MPSSWYKEFMSFYDVDVGSRKPDNPRRYTGRPMDLANMRMNGVRALSVECLDCFHRANVDVDDQPGHLPVPSFAARMKCSACGSKRVTVRPAWNSKPLQIPKP